MHMTLYDMRAPLSLIKKKFGSPHKKDINSHIEHATKQVNRESNFERRH